MYGKRNSGSGHSTSGSRGNSKIGTKVNPNPANGPATKGGKSPKSATAFQTHGKK